ncbi:hypothetical protein ACFV2D_01970 [Streptomyces capillispiralis]|uniref:hypothetical protein n=1 Tax=Streptomyces capillispiralis TaxID=68182 RepID=UPI0036858E22
MTSQASVSYPPAPSASRPSRPRRPRHARVAAAALALAGALGLTACGGDGPDDSDGSTATPTPSATATADTGGGTGDSGASDAPADALEGSWFTTADGKALALMFNGEEAALFVTGGTVCSGTARESAGTRSIRLKCADGAEGRTNGTVDSVGRTSLKVTWEGALGTETYTKAEGGTLPTDLPTAGPGS